MSRKPRKNSLPRRLLERVLLTLLVLLCVGLFYIAVILAEVPPEDQGAVPTKTAAVTLAPDQPRRIDSLGNLYSLTANFPAPVLAIQPSTAIAFDSGLVNDLAYQGTFARMVTLSYHTPEGYSLTLQSIYPGDAFSLLPGEGYSLKSDLTATLAGMAAVRMEKMGSVRLHVRGENGLYVFTAPDMPEETLSALVRQAFLAMPQE